MPDENVEIGEPVRRVWAALSERDWDAFAAELDPEMRYTPVEEQVVYRGPEAVTQYAARWLEAWEPFLGEVTEVVSAPVENRALAALRFRGRGKGSGVEIDDRLLLGLPSCAAAGSTASANTATVPMPSKPRGCRSRALAMSHPRGPATAQRGRRPLPCHCSSSPVCTDSST